MRKLIIVLALMLIATPVLAGYVYHQKHKELTRAERHELRVAERTAHIEWIFENKFKDCFGKKTTRECERYDLNDDGVVGVPDFSLFLQWSDKWINR